MNGGIKCVAQHTVESDNNKKGVTIASSSTHTGRSPTKRNKQKQKEVKKSRRKRESEERKREERRPSMHTSSSRHLIRFRQQQPLPLLSLLPHSHHACMSRVPRPQAPGHHYSKEAH